MCFYAPSCQVFIVNMKQVLVIKCCYSDNLIWICWKFEPHNKLPCALLTWKAEGQSSLETLNFDSNAVFHKNKWDRDITVVQNTKQI